MDPQNGKFFGHLTKEDAVRIRKALGFTQAGFATELGLGARAWTGIETGEAKLRLIHKPAIERLALHYAAVSDPMLAPADAAAMQSH